jgi:4-hydroxyphenylpyruvate dioxygenase
MSTPTAIGIRRLDTVHYYVHDLERSRRFYVDLLDFAEAGVSSPELERAGRQRSMLFQAGDVRVLVSQPLGEGGRAWRYLRKHPDGIGTLVFEVDDVARTFELLESRGATAITDVQRHEGDGGALSFFSITTPFGDTTFRFVERRGFRPLFPGFVMHDRPRGGQNRFGFGAVDHVTSNFQTMKPALLWLEHVLGFERFWDIEFHTADVDPTLQTGSGLRSAVYWDPASGVRFANNEPRRPFFKASQINLFGEDHRGDGVQHVALTTPSILPTVRGLRERGVVFMETPSAYYDALPERLRRIGVDAIDEPIDSLRELGILVDGSAHHKYMLQIFLKESSGLYGDPAAGPFFYEIIERKGDRGFGGGNFRALFESIERDQRAHGR